MTAPQERSRSTRQERVFQRLLARRSNGPPDLSFLGTIPDPPAGVDATKRCSNPRCWSHDPTSDENIPIPWTEFYEDRRAATGLTSRCKTCMSIAQTPSLLQNLPQAPQAPQETEQAPPLPAPLDPPVETPAPAQEPAPASPVPRQTAYTPAPAQLSVCALISVEDKDGDRWLVPLGFGPLIGLGKQGAEEVTINLPFAPGDAPQTITVTGDHARQLELFGRLLAASVKVTNATVAEEAIVLWERETARGRHLEQQLHQLEQDTIQELAGLREELEETRKLAEEREQKRHETAQRLTRVEQHRVSLERQVNELGRTDIGEAMGLVADEQEKVRRLMAQVEKLEERLTQTQQRLTEARQQKSELSRRVRELEARDTPIAVALEQAVHA